MRKIERFDKYMAFKGLNDNKVTVDLGFSNGTIGKSRKEGRDLSDRVVAKILDFYQDLNRVWLLTGEGDMLNSSGHALGGVYSASQKDEEVSLVDYVPVSAHASFIEDLSGGTADMDKYPIVATPAERKEIDKYKVFEVEGDSMYPTLSSGALVLVKEMPERSWHYAEGVVVAVYLDYVVVKRVYRNDLLTNKCLILKSDNEAYGQMPVQMSDLRALYKCKRIISSEIR